MHELFRCQFFLTGITSVGTGGQWIGYTHLFGMFLKRTIRACWNLQVRYFVMNLWQLFDE